MDCKKTQEENHNYFSELVMEIRQEYCYPDVKLKANRIPMEKLLKFANKDEKNVHLTKG